MDLSTNQGLMEMQNIYPTKYDNHMFRMNKTYEETDIKGNNNRFNSLKTETNINHAHESSSLFQVKCTKEKKLEVDNSLFSYSSFKKAMDLRTHNRTLDGSKRTIFDDAEYFAKNYCYKLLPITFEQVDETIIQSEHNYSLSSLNSESEVEEDCSRTMDYSQVKEKNYKRRKTKLEEGEEEDEQEMIEREISDEERKLEFEPSSIFFQRNENDDHWTDSVSPETENSIPVQPLDLSAPPLVQEEKTDHHLRERPNSIVRSDEIAQPDSDKENVNLEANGIRVTITRPDEKENYQPCDLFLNDIARLVPWLIDKDCFEVDILDRTCDHNEEFRKHRLYYVISEATWRLFKESNERVILTNDKSLGQPLTRVDKDEKPSYLVFDQFSLAKCLAEYCNEIGGCFEYNCIEDGKDEVRSKEEVLEDEVKNVQKMEEEMKKMNEMEKKEEKPEEEIKDKHQTVEILKNEIEEEKPEEEIKDQHEAVEIFKNEIEENVKNEEHKTEGVENIEKEVMKVKEVSETPKNMKEEIKKVDEAAKRKKMKVNKVKRIAERVKKIKKEVKNSDEAAENDKKMEEQVKKEDVAEKLEKQVNEINRVVERIEDTEEETKKVKKEAKDGSEVVETVTKEEAKTTEDEVKNVNEIPEKKVNGKKKVRKVKRKRLRKVKKQVKNLHEAADNVKKAEEEEAKKLVEIVKNEEKEEVKDINRVAERIESVVEETEKEKKEAKNRDEIVESLTKVEELNEVAETAKNIKEEVENLNEIPERKENVKKKVKKVRKKKLKKVKKQVKNPDEAAENDKKIEEQVKKEEDVAEKVKKVEEIKQKKVEKEQEKTGTEKKAVEEKERRTDEKLIIRSGTKRKKKEKEDVVNDNKSINNHCLEKETTACSSNAEEKIPKTELKVTIEKTNEKQARPENKKTNQQMRGTKRRKKSPPIQPEPNNRRITTRSKSTTSGSETSQISDKPVSKKRKTEEPTPTKRDKSTESENFRRMTRSRSGTVLEEVDAEKPATGARKRCKVETEEVVERRSRSQRVSQTPLKARKR